MFSSLISKSSMSGVSSTKTDCLFPPRDVSSAKTVVFQNVISIMIHSSFLFFLNYSPSESQILNLSRGIGGFTFLSVQLHPFCSCKQAWAWVEVTTFFIACITLSKGTLTHPAEPYKLWHFNIGWLRLHCGSNNKAELETPQFGFAFCIFVFIYWLASDIFIDRSIYYSKSKLK